MTDDNGSADAGNPGGNAAPPEWLGGFDEGTRAALTAKGWVDPDPAKVLAKALPSYLNLEKTFGADRAGRTVVLPGEKPTPEEVKAYHTKIGVPETADGYKFEVGEGADENMIAWARGTFHKAGVPASAANAIVKEWEGFAQAAQKQAAEAETAERVKAFDEWKGKHGAKFDEHVGMAKKAMTALGIAPEKAEQIDDLFKAMGQSGLGGVDLLAKLATDYGIGKEADLIEGKSGAFGVGSPEAAKAALRELEASEAYMKVAFDKNAPGRQEMMDKRQKLYDAAYGTKALFTSVGRIA